MRRIALAFALVAALLAPAGVAAGSDSGSGSTRCSVDISPDSGGPTDVYRITVSNVPVDPDGGSVEVRLVIKLLGTHNLAPPEGRPPRSRRGATSWTSARPTSTTPAAATRRANSS